MGRVGGRLTKRKLIEVSLPLEAINKQAVEEVVLEVSAENASGFSEALARTVGQKSWVLGFDLGDFGAVQW
jgi:hypothetical protein